ncbi:PAS domain S-box protein [Salinibaculum rarum]|uniref:PAS domain S-box protein n=1 Tax=Salinibaculum rarum TaxID=3058903 RepID=UPI00265F1130|nr:PAS domain S-box protein [Salinibaculum sp. KK48]
MVSPTTVAWGAFGLVPLILGLAGLAWHKRDEPAGVPVAVYHFLLAAGTVSYGARLLVRDPAAKFLITSGSLVVMSAFVTSWVVVACVYTGHRDWLTRPVFAVLAVEPVVVAIAAAVPPLRTLLYRNPSTGDAIPATGGIGSYSSLGVEAEPLVFVHFLYMLCLMVIATGLFLNLFLRARHLNRGQAVALLGAAFAPWLTVLAQTFNITTVDLSFLTWTLAGVAITTGLYRIRLLDPVPVGRSAAIEEMGDGIFILDEDDRIADTNPAADRMFGIEDRQVRGTPVTTVLTDWDALSDDEEWTELPVDVDGERRYVEVQTEPFTDYLDRRVGRLVVVRDVTERKHREQTLARYQTVFETVQDRVYVLDSEGQFLLVNDPLASLLDRERAELAGEPFESVLAPSAEPFNPVEAGVETTDEPVELQVRVGDGETLPVETQFSPVEFGDVQGVVGYVRDISRRKETERTLAETAERLETLVHASPLAIVATDTEGDIHTWNPAAEEMFGYTEAEALGGPPPIIPDERSDEITERFERTLDGERFRDVETQLERRDGQLVDASVSIAPQFSPADEVLGTVSVIADITERKERERRLQRQNDRLDQFAGIVSHDLRNPLNVASGRLELARDESDSDHLEHVADALDRMETLIEDTLTLARDGQTVAETEPVAVDTLAENCWDTVATGDTAATLDVGDPLCIEADADRLQQVLENLFRNAIEHGREDVTIHIGRLDDGFYVEDDGPGIPEDRRDDVFQPGETFDPAGTGFGLAIVREIVEAHGWTVAVTEGTDGGARFEITGVKNFCSATSD